VEVENQIWNTFYNLHSFQIFTDFELFQRFRVKVNLTDFCSVSVIEILIAIRPALQSGQEVHPSVVQGLSQHPADMHKKYPPNE
jgi:hypothetical protein